MALFLFLVLSVSIPLLEGDGRSHHQAEMQHSPTRSHDSKSIQYTKDKDLIDCVDMYKQPAFKHPLLKNHKIQLHPTFLRKTLQSTPSHDSAFYNRNFTKGCPRGKVPIHNRIKIMHEKGITSELQAQDFRQFSQDCPQHHFTTFDTTTTGTIYHGATASIGTYNLSLQLNQYSLSQIWVQSGPPTELNSIQVGAGIHPSLYGDNTPRVTGYWTEQVDNFQRTGCFNILCPGFVQVDTKRTFGEPLLPSSTIGKRPKYYALMKVRQDKSTGHWWLIGYDAGEAVSIGYWPMEIFTHLRDGASLIKYGGETFTTPPSKQSPPMGSGELPKTLYLNSASMATLKIVDSKYRVLDIYPDDMKIYSDTSPNCYDLLYAGDQGDPFGQAFLFGGPGGECGV